MAIDVEALKASVDMVAVIGNYTPLKRIGREYKGPCPIHKGEDPNFSVNPEKRIWRCFSHGCDRDGNDIIAFIQKVEGLDFPRACEFLGAKRDWTPRFPVSVSPKRPPRETMKPPMGITLSLDAMATREYGRPEIAREFLDLDGSLICYEARYPRGSDKSQPDKSPSRMWTWGIKQGDEKPTWGCGGWSGYRPLYGLHRIAALPDAQVVIFEGPKKADVGHEFFPHLACISWSGGAGAWHKHAWEPIAGRKVVLWPDADDTGLAACEKIADFLTDQRGKLKCQEVKVIDPFKAFK